MLTWASQLIVQLFHIPSGECCEQSHQTTGMSLLQTIHCMVMWAGYQLHDLPLHQEVWYEEFCLVQILINWHIHEIYNHLKPHCCVLEEEKITRKHQIVTYFCVKLLVQPPNLHLVQILFLLTPCYYRDIGYIVPTYLVSLLKNFSSECSHLSEPVRHFPTSRYSSNIAV